MWQYKTTILYGYNHKHIYTTTSAMMATVPYFKVMSNKCTVVGICSIRNTFPQALPVDKHVIKKWEAGCALWMCYRSTYITRCPVREE